MNNQIFDMGIGRSNQFENIKERRARKLQQKKTT